MPEVDPGRELGPFRELYAEYGELFEEVNSLLCDSATGRAELDRTVAFAMGLGAHQSSPAFRSIEGKRREYDLTQISGLSFEIYYALALKQMVTSVHQPEDTGNDPIRRAYLGFWEKDLRPRTLDDPRIENELHFYNGISELIAANITSFAGLSKNDYAAILAAKRLVIGASEKCYSHFRTYSESEVKTAFMSYDLENPHTSIVREFIVRFDPELARQLEGKLS